MATPFKQVKNNAFSTLSGAINSAVTALNIQSGHGTRFPATASGAFWATIWKAASYTDPFDDPNLEIVLVNTRATDAFSSITRAQLGTTAHAHEDGDKIALLVVDQSLIDIHTAINALENTAVTLTGIQTLTNKTLTLPIIGSGGATFNGSTSGTTLLKATAIAGSTTLTLPAATDTLVGKATTDTLTNKTLTGGLVTADPVVALGIASKQYVDGFSPVGLVENEVPGGSINSSNTVFTTASAFATGALRVYRNGIRLKGGGADYTAGASGFTMVTAPNTGDVLLVDYNVSSSSFSIGTNSNIWNETPTGSVNGSNTLFTLARAYVSGSLQVHIDGLLQRITTDFTETTPGSGTFTFTTAPATGQSVRVHYQYNLNPSGNSDTVDGFHANATPTANQVLPLDSNARIPVAAVPMLFTAGLNTASPADATTFWVGTGGFGSGGAEQLGRFYMPFAGVLTSCYLNAVTSGTVGTTEASTVSLRLNNTTDTVISSAVVFDNGQHVYSNTGLSVAFAAGDFIAFKLLTPTWVTNPGNITLGITARIN